MITAFKVWLLTVLLGFVAKQFFNRGVKMEKDIAIGSEGKLVLKLEAGKIVIEVSDVHASGSVSLSVSEDAGYFLDKLAALIPGQIDDALIAVIKTALKAV